MVILPQQPALEWRSGGECWPLRRKFPVQLELDFRFVTGVCSTLYLEVNLSLNLELLMDLANEAQAFACLYIPGYRRLVGMPTSYLVLGV